MGLTESLVHFSPGYLDKFSQKKIKLNGSSQTWCQMKGMAKTLKKSLKVVYFLYYRIGVPKVNNALDEMDSNGIVVSSEQNQAPAFFPLFLLWSQFLSVERF